MECSLRYGPTNAMKETKHVLAIGTAVLLAVTSVVPLAEASKTARFALESFPSMPAV